MQIMTQLLVFDTRSINADAFQTEASIAAFHRSTELFIHQLCQIAKEHPTWLKFPEGVIVPISPDKFQIYKDITKDAAVNQELMATRFVNLCNDPKHFWSIVIADIIQIANQYSNECTKAKSIQPIRLTCFAPSLAIVGFESDEANVMEGITLLGKYIQPTAVRIEFTIISVLISETSNNKIIKAISMRLKAMETPTLSIQIRTIVNSPLYFDDELRKLIISSSPLAKSNILLSSAKTNMSCCLNVILSPMTLTAADAMHAQLGTLETVSIVIRSGIAPSCISGKCLRVTAAAYDTSTYADVDSFAANKLLFNRICHVLATLDCCLVLKAVRQLPLHQQFLEYWLLVPPSSDLCHRSDFVPQMDMLLLVDKEDYLGPQPQHDMDSNRLCYQGMKGMMLEAEVDQESVMECDSFLTELIGHGMIPASEYTPMAYPSDRIHRLVTIANSRPTAAMTYANKQHTTGSSAASAGSFAKNASIPGQHASCTPQSSHLPAKTMPTTSLPRPNIPTNNAKSQPSHPKLALQQKQSVTGMDCCTTNYLHQKQPVSAMDCYTSNISSRQPDAKPRHGGQPPAAAPLVKIPTYADTNSMPMENLQDQSHSYSSRRGILPSATTTVTTQHDYKGDSSDDDEVADLFDTSSSKRKKKPSSRAAAPKPSRANLNSKLTANNNIQSNFGSPIKKTCPATKPRSSRFNLEDTDDEYGL